MTGFLYLWFDRKHKRYYLGSHWGSPDDGYVCSSHWMKRAYQKRPCDFKRRVLKYINSSPKDLLIEENRWLNMIKEYELRKRYYNLTNRAFGHWNASYSNQKILSLKEKISLQTKTAMNDVKIRKRYLNGLKQRNNKSSDPLVREKRRQSMLQTMAKKYPIKQRRKRMKFGSEEYCEYMRQHVKQRWQSQEYRQMIGPKISAGLKGTQNRLGHTNSPEHRKHISESLKRKYYSEIINKT